QAEFLVRLLPWLPEQERAPALTAALNAGGLLADRALSLPGLVETLPARERPGFLDLALAAARAMNPAGAATAVLAVARSPGAADRRALLREAARLYRDGQLEPGREAARPGDWLPFSAGEIALLDLREALEYSQVAGDDDQAGEYATGLLHS